MVGTMVSRLVAYLVLKKIGDKVTRWSEAEECWSIGAVQMAVLRRSINSIPPIGFIRPLP